MRNEETHEKLRMIEKAREVNCQVAKLLKSKTPRWYIPQGIFVYPVTNIHTYCLKVTFCVCFLLFYRKDMIYTPLPSMNPSSSFPFLHLSYLSHRPVLHLYLLSFTTTIQQTNSATLYFFTFFNYLSLYTGILV